MSSPNAAVPRRAARWGLFLCGVLGIALRYPDLLAEPRIWGEEGSIYLRDAFSKPWLETLFAPAVGYYGLFLTVPSTVAAHLVPLEYVAHVTTGVGFLGQLVPIALIVWGRAPLWQSLWHRAIGVAAVVLNPLSEEMWLTTTCLQFHFVLVAFFVLLEPLDSDGPHGRRRRWTERTLLLVSGLSGPPPCMLAPLFLAQALWTRHREASVRAGILTAATLLQLLVAITGMKTEVGSDLRFAGLDFPTIAFTALDKLVLVPFFGLSPGIAFAKAIEEVRRGGPDELLVMGIVCALLLGAALLLAARSAEAAARAVFLGAIALLVLSSMYLGIGDRKSWVHPACAGRYFHAPAVLFMLLLLSQLEFGKGVLWSANQKGLALCLALGLAVQLGDWQRQLIPRAELPRWRDEVAAFRRNPEHRLAIWPAGWGFEIPRRAVKAR